MDTGYEDMLAALEDIIPYMRTKDAAFLSDMLDAFEADPTFEPSEAQGDWIKDLYERHR